MKSKLYKFFSNKKELKIYRSYYLEAYSTLSEVIKYYIDLNKTIAIWGAGLKGIAFLSVYDPHCQKIQYVFDIDKMKYNTYLNTGHLISDYNSHKDVSVILIMNNNYENEIAGILKKNNISALLINVDSVILGKMTRNEIIKSIEENKCQ